MNRLTINAIRKAYLDAYGQLLDVVSINDGEVMAISVPLHIVGHSRVEFQILAAANGILLSDAGRTLQELQLSGYAASGALAEKIVRTVEQMGARVGRHAIVYQCSPANLGGAMQRFAEILKTVGDFYLALRQPSEPKRSTVLARVGKALSDAGANYQAEKRLRGRIEQHSIDFFIPRNGRPPWAIEVLGGQETHSQAMIWDFRCRDIKSANADLNVGIIFDDEDGAWSERSRKILKSAADLVIPSSNLSGGLFGVDAGPFAKH